MTSESTPCLRPRVTYYLSIVAPFDVPENGAIAAQADATASSDRVVAVAVCNLCCNESQPLSNVSYWRTSCESRLPKYDQIARNFSCVFRLLLLQSAARFKYDRHDWALALSRSLTQIVFTSINKNIAILKCRRGFLHAIVELPCSSATECFVYCLGYFYCSES